ncbi:Metallo-dependent phosphatase-like protein [Podospora conica]|nr:Metallo-dependent phosphatase-like protein [Schizothecium conicum]
MDSKEAPPKKGRATRRTRIVCISDTHNFTAIKIPKGDVLIHAGDLTNQGSYSELSKTVEWLEKLDFEAKIVVAGNHDITLDKTFYTQLGHRFHNQEPQDPARCESLLTTSPTITYLCNESAMIKLRNPDGPRTEFKVYGSPHVPHCGLWAFCYGPHPHPDLETLPARPGKDIWNAIPSDTDILVTHTPALGHCDYSPVAERHLGCEDLSQALGRVRPRLHVCGHVHHARGAERLRWQLDPKADGVYPALVASAEIWKDPNTDPLSAKMSLFDLTRRQGNRPLDFDDDLSSGGAASSGRGAGRRETGVVNCAIMATNWPHIGGKKTRKPIVVDLDLPVAE